MIRTHVIYFHCRFSQCTVCSLSLLNCDTVYYIAFPYILEDNYKRYTHTERLSAGKYNDITSLCNMIIQSAQWCFPCLTYMCWKVWCVKPIWDYVYSETLAEWFVATWIFLSKSNIFLFTGCMTKEVALERKHGHGLGILAPVQAR